MNRLKGLAASLLVAGLLAGLPAVLVALGVPGVFTRGGSLVELLLRPDDGTLVLGILWVLGWLVWAILAVTILVELVAAVGHLKVPTLAGFHLPQSLAQQLIGTAALLFLTTTTVNPGIAHAAPPTPASITATHQPAFTGGLAEAAASTPAPKHQVPGHALAATTTSYVVQPGDSLWRIAERHLGGGERYRDIVDLNTDLLGGRPDFLQSGWTLALPTTPSRNAAPGAPIMTVTVAAGDTLRELARTHLGDADRWPEIFHASTSIDQPGGRRLTHPDQIDIGWTLTIPQHPAVPAPAALPAAAHGEQDPRPGEPTPAAVPDSSSAPADAASADPTPLQQDVPAAVSADELEPVTASWLVPGLIGGGLLCGSLALALHRRRAIQARYRRPGRALPATPPELAPIEKTVITHPQLAANVGTLDRVLHWTATQQVVHALPVPSIMAVDLDAERVTLHLAEEQTLVHPWRADPTGQHWTLQLTDLTDLDTAASGQAAWPQLVTIGTTDAGATWLLNAEEAGTIHLTGDPTHAADFARYLVAELALNPWSCDVRVDCLNTCAELVDLAPVRVRHHTTETIISDTLSDAVNTVDRLTTLDVPDLGDARASDAGDDLWPSRVLVIDHHESDDDLDTLLETLTGHVGRTGTSVLLTNAEHAPTGGLEIHLTSSGRTQLPTAGLDLITVGLTSEEANGCASLLAVADSADDEPIPASPRTPAQPDAVLTNLAGQIIDPRLLPRDTITTNATSILSGPDEDYLHVGATTREDLAALAPQVPAEVTQQAERDDPDLDADLTEWLSGDGQRPRLRVLGPLSARVGPNGNPIAVVKRKPFYTELLAYLATRTHGATVVQVAEAIGIQPGRVRGHVSVVRDWLGIDPSTRQPHIPEALKSKAARDSGIGSYEVNNLLLDADLFTRLRRRGEARGPDGIKDLKTALSLVTGTPYSDLRPKGGAWLIDSAQPHHLTCAIIDTAHLVNLDALRSGDYPTARAAAELAILAAPHEETPRLDLAAVATAQGHDHQAQELLETSILGEAQDPSLELSKRTSNLLTNKRWLSNSKAS